MSHDLESAIAEGATWVRIGTALFGARDYGQANSLTLIDKDSAMSNTRIAFVGAGNMAASLIGGLRAQGVARSAIRASDPGDEHRARVSSEHGIDSFADNAEAIEGADRDRVGGQAASMKAVCQAIRTEPEAQANW